MILENRLEEPATSRHQVRHYCGKSNGQQGCTVSGHTLQTVLSGCSKKRLEM